MQTVVQAAVVYIFLLIVFRIAGRRTVAQLTTFDFVLVLVISEATQSALVADDTSLTGAFLAILTLIAMDVLLSLIKIRLKSVERWLDGVPMVIVRDGKPLDDLMRRARVDMDDVLSAARESHGLPNLESVAHAVLEANGRISIIPREPDARR